MGSSRGANSFDANHKPPTGTVVVIIVPPNQSADLPMLFSDHYFGVI